MSFHVPEKYRILKPHRLGTDASAGNNGAFVIHEYFPKSIRKRRGEIARSLFCIASDGLGWEHVSVHAHIPLTDSLHTPNWSEMCEIKDLFWDPEDVVMQLHPARSEYVNMHPNVLHLWRPTKGGIPIPPPILVGVK